MEDDKIQQAIDTQQTADQYGVAKTPYHTHNGTDSPRVDISSIARFPSTPSDGDSIVFSASMNQWVVGSGGGANASSHGASTTSIPNGTATQVKLNSNDFTNGITWDGTNFRFVIDSDGQYLIVAGIRYTNIAGGNQYTAEVRKNGGLGAVASTSQGGTAGWDVTILASGIVDLVATDYIELWTRQISGGSQNISNSSATYMALAEV